MEVSLQIAVELHKAGNLQEAKKMYSSILSEDPDNADALHLLGVAHYQQGEPKEASQWIRKAIDVNDNVASYHSNLGNAQLGQGEVDEALSSFRRAQKISPNFADAYFNEASLYQKAGELDKAGQILGALVKRNKQFALGYARLGSILRQQGKLKRAEKSLREAIRLQPSLAEAHSSLANLLFARDRWNESAVCFEKALSIQSQFPEALTSFGMLLHQMGELEAAERLHRSAISVQPKFAEAHWHLALLLLSQKEFAEAWPEFLWNWQRAGHLFHPELAPLWDGKSDLSGKKILVYSEQGLGDAIQFIRYTKLLKERGAFVIAEVPPKIIRLLSSLDSVDEWIEDGHLAGQVDYQLPLMMLPALFGSTYENCLAEKSYLKAETSKSNWREKLNSGKRLRVGIAWQGQKKYFLDPWRSISLREFEGLLEVEDVEFVSLQKFEGQEQIKKLRDPDVLTDFTNELDEGPDAFIDTAALLDDLDLVISSDTSIAHLAGALGKPCWVLLSKVPDWRWFLEGEDCAWYPSLRLFRQEERGNWSSVFSRVKSELENFGGGRSDG